MMTIVCMSRSTLKCPVARTFLEDSVSKVGPKPKYILDGKPISLREMSERSGLSKTTIGLRLNKGFSVKEAMTLPRGMGAYRKKEPEIFYKGRRATISEWSKITGLREDTIRARWNARWAAESILEKPERICVEESGCHPLYSVWHGIVKRCTHTSNPKYPDYGGRGIKMCDRWLNDFWAFVEDIGTRPSEKHSLDRIDPNRNYEPDNCRWANPTEQSRNTRRATTVTIKGMEVTLHELCEALEIPYKEMKSRLDRGMSIPVAISRGFQV